MDTFDEQAELSREERVRGALSRGECPTCGEEVSRRIDPRQKGHKGGHQGSWVNYRCSCGFARDYVEPV